MDVDLYADLENPFFSVSSPDAGAVRNEGSGSSYLETEVKKLENLNLCLPAEWVGQDREPIWKGLVNNLTLTRIDICIPANAKLTAQNSALKKNISCLYKTSRFELERKESSIKSLRQRIEALEAALYQVQSTKQNCDVIIDVPQSVQPIPQYCQDGVLYGGSYGPAVGAFVPKEGKDTPGIAEFKQKRVPSPPQFEAPNIDSMTKEKKHTVQPSSTELLYAAMSKERQIQASPPPSKQRTHNSTRRDMQEGHPKLSSAYGKENRRRTGRDMAARRSEGPPRAQCEVEKPTLKREERQHDSLSLRGRGSKLERRGHKRQLSQSPVKRNSRAETTRTKRRKVDSVGDSARPQRTKVPKGVHKKSLPRPVSHGRNGGEVPVELSNKASAKEDASTSKSNVPAIGCAMKEVGDVIDTAYCRMEVETKAREQCGVEFSQRRSHCFLSTATASPDPTLEDCTVDPEVISDSAAKSPGSSTIIPAATALTPTLTPEESIQLEDGEILSESDSDVPHQPISASAMITKQKSQLTSRERLDKHLNQSGLKVSSRYLDQGRTRYCRDTQPDHHRKRAITERHERDNLPSRSHHRSRESSRPKPWIY